MKSFIEHIHDIERRKGVFENASSGATSAANVAAVAAPLGGLGVGFDPNGDKGIYEKPKGKKKGETTVIRR